MRLFILLTIFSLPVMACPNLSGKYLSCKSTTGQTSGSSNVVITQKLASGITTFTMTSTDDDTHERSTETLIADGKVRSKNVVDPDSGITLKMDQKGVCQATTLTISETVYINGQLLAKSDSKVTKTGNTLKIVISGTMDGQSFSDTVLCQ